MLFSCKNKQAETIEPEPGLIEITKAQFQSENMEFGKPAFAVFSDVVHITGNIIPSVQGQAQISLPVQGLITRIHCKPGEMINKGGLMFDVSGNEFVDMQKDFAESAALLKRLKADYDRVKELSNENIGTKKDFVVAESAYNAESAKLKALVIKLENIGLDVSKIEGGTFYASYTLKAPIKGYVNQVNATIGQHVQSEQTIAEIIDTESFQLRLSIFEKDIYKIETGQKVEFYSSGNKTVKYAAKLSSVGKTINENTMSIDCLAEIENLKNARLVGNQFVEGEIIVTSDSLLSLPQSAIIASENENFVLVLENETDELYKLRKAKVSTGRIINGFVEIAEMPESKKILIKGVYNLVIE
jgi:cobalt-zinc-cadmium efflux system membrane fusion protein